jgi:predicted NUDIX family NTP pyrophosphohydrolase
MAERDLYCVALKVFLEHNGNLFIFKDRYGDWDIPGGRIEMDEFSTPS